MKKFEYLEHTITSRDKKTYLQEIDNLGKKGWEMVNFQIVKLFFTVYITYYFKRELLEK